MGVPEELLDALGSAVREMMDGRTAVAFSGGLDSGVIAAIASGHGSIRAYTVGTEGSYDVRASEELARDMGIEWEHIPLTASALEEDLRDMIRITGTVNPITLSFEVPLYYVMRHSPERVILSGQGADEIFAGYSKYENLDGDDLRDRMDRDMMELMRNTLVHERKVADRFGKRIGYPYLDPRVTSIASAMDIGDLAPRDLRKTVLRDVAGLLGQPGIAARPKKAAQYGSGTMDTLRRMAKGRGMTVSSMIAAISEGSI